MVLSSAICQTSCLNSLLPLIQSCINQYLTFWRSDHCRRESYFCNVCAECSGMNLHEWVPVEMRTPAQKKKVEGCEARPRPGEHEKGAQHSKYIYRLQVTNSHGKIFNVEKHTRSWNKLARSIYICMHASRKKYIISPLLFERNLYHPSYFRKQEQVAQ
jgi:hypothetical protein